MRKIAMLFLSLSLLSGWAYGSVDAGVNVNLGHDRNLSFFYESLAPHGTWHQAEKYGWVWQPEVVLSENDWRPYDNNGHWIWTDDGWFWVSDYDWGWAPFHYGRWSYDDN